MFRGLGKQENYRNMTTRSVPREERRTKTIVWCGTGKRQKAKGKKVGYLPYLQAALHCTALQRSCCCLVYFGKVRGYTLCSNPFPNRQFRTCKSMRALLWPTFDLSNPIFAYWSLLHSLNLCTRKPHAVVNLNTPTRL